MGHGKNFPHHKTTPSRRQHCGNGFTTTTNDRHGGSHKILQNLQHLASTPDSPLSHMRRLHGNSRPPLRMAQQLRWPQKLPLLLRFRRVGFRHGASPSSLFRSPHCAFRKFKPHIFRQRIKRTKPRTSRFRNDDIRHPRSAVSGQLMGISFVSRRQRGDDTGILERT